MNAIRTYTMEDGIPTPAGMFVRTSDDDKTVGMPEAGELAREGRLNEVVALQYEQAVKSMKKGRYTVCYASNLTEWEREDWLSTNDFDLASEQVTEVATFLLTLRRLRTAKVWFEDRFEEDGSRRALPVCWGVTPLNATERDVPADKWALLPLSRTEEALLSKSASAGKRSAHGESDVKPPEFKPLPPSAEPTGLQSVLAGGIDPASVPLDSVMAATAKSIQEALFGKPDTAPCTD